MPNISFIGHLSGILVGLFTVYGVFDLFLPAKGEISILSYVMLKISDMYTYLETVVCCKGFANLSNFIKHNGERTFAITQNNHTTGGTTILGTANIFLSNIGWLLLQVWFVIAAIFHIIGCPMNVFEVWIQNQWNGMWNICRGWFTTNSTNSSHLHPIAVQMTPVGNGRSSTSRSQYQPLSQSEGRSTDNQLDI